jgi:hypothetical protein
MNLQGNPSRHCEERKRRSNPGLSPPVRPWIASLTLAMTETNTIGVIPGHAKREPGISRYKLEIPDRSAPRPVRNDEKQEETI